MSYSSRFDFIARIIIILVFEMSMILFTLYLISKERLLFHDYIVFKEKINLNSMNKLSLGKTMFSCGSLLDENDRNQAIL